MATTHHRRVETWRVRSLAVFLPILAAAMGLGNDHVLHDLSPLDDMPISRTPPDAEATFENSESNMKVPPVNTIPEIPHVEHSAKELPVDATFSKHRGKLGEDETLFAKRLNDLIKLVPDI